MAVVTIGVRRESTARGSGKVWARPGADVRECDGWRVWLEAVKGSEGAYSEQFQRRGWWCQCGRAGGMELGGSSSRSSGRKVVDVGDVVGGY